MSAPLDPNRHLQVNIQPNECEASAHSLASDTSCASATPCASANTPAGASPIAEYLDLMWQGSPEAADCTKEVNTPLNDLTLCYHWQDVTSSNLQLCLAMRLLILTGKLPPSRVRDLCLAAVAALLNTISG